MSDDTKVKISDIASFLFEPLQYSATKLFGKDYEKRIERDTLEPLVFDKKTSSDIKKILLKKAIFDIRQSGKGADEYLGGLDIYSIEELKKYRTISRPYFSATLNKLIADIKQILDNMKSKISLDFNIETDRTANLDKIEGDYCWHNADFIDTNAIKVYSPSSTKKHLSSYITALCLIAESDCADIEWDVFLYYSKPDDKTEKSFTISTTAAKETLELILHNINSFKRCIPYDFVTEGKVDKFSNLSEFYSALTQSFGPWDYFEHKNMFTLEDLGYSESGFGAELESAVSEYRKFFPAGY